MDKEYLKTNYKNAGQTAFKAGQWKRSGRAIACLVNKPLRMMQGPINVSEKGMKPLLIYALVQCLIVIQYTINKCQALFFNVSDSKFSAFFQRPEKNYRTDGYPAACSSGDTGITSKAKTDQDCFHS